MSSPAARRFFRVAGLVLAVETEPGSVLPLHPKLDAFEVREPGPDPIPVRHRFRAFEKDAARLGRLRYDRPPYQVFETDSGWIYRIGADAGGPVQTAVFARDYGAADIYTPGPIDFPEAGADSLTLLPTDQILLAPVLAARGGCLLHAAGIVDRGGALLFAGHSTAGKSSMVRMWKGRAEILCDDRIALRPEGTGFRAYGTWSHGDVPDISPASAPLRALFLLRKAPRNEAVRLTDRREIVRIFLDLVIKPLATPSWWERTLAVAERMAAGVAAYELSFDLEGGVVEAVRSLDVDIPSESR